MLYASRQLKQTRAADTVAEQDIYDYVLAWKKTWSSEEKRLTLASTIRNLVVLGWLRAQVSEELLEVA